MIYIFLCKDSFAIFRDTKDYFQISKISDKTACPNQSIASSRLFLMQYFSRTLYNRM